MGKRIVSRVIGLEISASLRLNALFVATMLASGAALAQSAASPVAAASEANLSDAVKKQAASPYKWILLNNTTRAPKKETPKEPAPSAAAAAAAAAAAPATASAGNSASAALAAAARRADVAEVARVAAAASAAAAAAPVVVARAPAPVVAAPVAPPPPPPTPAPVVAAVAPKPVVAPPPPPPPPKVNTELVVVTQVEPKLTPSILRDITQGSVKVSFTVNPDGSTADVKVDSSTARVLNNPVIAAVRDWKYKPIDIAQRTEIELAFKFD